MTDEDAINRLRDEANRHGFFLIRKEQLVRVAYDTSIEPDQMTSALQADFRSKEEEARVVGSLAFTHMYKHVRRLGVLRETFTPNHATKNLEYRVEMVAVVPMGAVPRKTEQLEEVS